VKLAYRLIDALARRLAAAHNKELHAVRRELDQLRNAVVALSHDTEAVAGTRKQLDKVLANQRIERYLPKKLVGEPCMPTPVEFPHEAITRVAE